MKWSLRQGLRRGRQGLLSRVYLAVLVLCLLLMLLFPAASILAHATLGEGARFVSIGEIGLVGPVASLTPRVENRKRLWSFTKLAGSSVPVTIDGKPIDEAGVTVDLEAGRKIELEMTPPGEAHRAYRLALDLADEAPTLRFRGVKVRGTCLLAGFGDDPIAVANEARGIDLPLRKDPSIAALHFQVCADGDGLVVEPRAPGAALSLLDWKPPMPRSKGAWVETPIERRMRVPSPARLKAGAATMTVSMVGGALWVQMEGTAVPSYALSKRGPSILGGLGLGGEIGFTSNRWDLSSFQAMTKILIAEGVISRSASGEVVLDPSKDPSTFDRVFDRETDREWARSTWKWRVHELNIDPGTRREVGFDPKRLDIWRLDSGGRLAGLEPDYLVQVLPPAGKGVVVPGHVRDRKGRVLDEDEKFLYETGLAVLVGVPGLPAAGGLRQVFGPVLRGEFIPPVTARLASLLGVSLHGLDVHLTIDLDVQRALVEAIRETEARLGPLRGLAVLLNEEGEILALLNWPLLRDEDDFRRELLASATDPFSRALILAFQQRLPSGSLSKLIFSLYALDRYAPELFRRSPGGDFRLVDANGKQIDDEGIVRVPGRPPIHAHDHEVRGPCEWSSAFGNSKNCCNASLALLLGGKRLAEALEDIGFYGNSSPHDLLPSELADPSQSLEMWIRRPANDPLRIVRTRPFEGAIEFAMRRRPDLIEDRSWEEMLRHLIPASFAGAPLGEGLDCAPVVWPLQMIVALTGEVRAPSLVAGIGNLRFTRPPARRGIKPETVEAMRPIMRATFDPDKHGTAAGSFKDSPLLAPERELMGKTGTAGRVDSRGERLSSHRALLAAARVLPGGRFAIGLWYFFEASPRVGAPTGTAAVDAGRRTFEKLMVMPSGAPVASTTAAAAGTRETGG